MKAILVNWKTTAGGIASLLAGVTILLKMLSGEEPFSTDQLAVAFGLIGVGIAGIAARDADKSSQDSGIRLVALGALLGSLLFSMPAAAGEPLASKTPADTITPGRKFDLWSATQAYALISYSFDTEEFGAGVRLAYDVNDHVRMRADYSSEDFATEDVGADSSLSLAFLYPVDAVPGLELYTITGIGVSDFENPALELIAGVGIEYEIKSWRIFSEYQYNSEDEDSVARLGLGVSF